MPETFEKPQTIKPEDEKASDKAAEKRIDHVAEEAAAKATKTVQHYDKDHTIFSN